MKEKGPVRNTGLRVNIGCGATPTAAWVNLDNSLTCQLARFPALTKLLTASGLLNPQQVRFATVARDTPIRWANAGQHIPLPRESVEVVYSSHMLEHLDPDREVPRFLAEVRRVLVAGGIIRVAVPDLLRSARRYVLETGDADGFVSSLLMAEWRPRGGLPVIRYLIAGFRNHRWMYDAASLGALLERHGFRSAREFAPGETMIPDPGSLNLREREEESIYVEAHRV